MVNGILLLHGRIILSHRRVGYIIMKLRFCKSLGVTKGTFRCLFTSHQNTNTFTKTHQHWVCSPSFASLFVLNPHIASPPQKSVSRVYPDGKNTRGDTTPTTAAHSTDITRTVNPTGRLLTVRFSPCAVRLSLIFICSW